MEKLCLTRSEEQNSEFDSAKHHQCAVAKNWKSEHSPELPYRLDAESTAVEQAAETRF